MNKNTNNNKGINNTTRFVNIRELTPAEIQEIFSKFGSYNKSAPVCRCSPKTFKKYYEEAKTIQTVAKKPETKSMMSDIFLDPEQSRVALLDIETSGLKSDFSMTICAHIKQYGTGYSKTFALDLDAQDLLESEKIMISNINNELNNFDGIITYFGSRFDMPFLRTRSFFYGLQPCPKIKHLDMYFTIRSTTNPSTRRMDRINQILQHADPDASPSKTTLGFTEWIRVLNSRDESALDYIVDHCEKDVLILENIVNEFKEFVPDRITRK